MHTASSGGPRGGTTGGTVVGRASRLPVACAAALVLFFATTVLAPALAPSAAAASIATLSDRSHKVDLLARLMYRPRLVFFGGSRSWRIPPSFARSYAGLKAFNFAVHEGTTEDVWAFSHHFVSRNPDGPLYVMSGLQPTIFSERQPWTRRSCATGA